MRYLRHKIDTVWPLFLILAVWEGLASLGLLNSRVLPPPSVLILSAIELARSGVLLENSLGSLERVSAGFLVASFLGVGAGLVLGAIPALARRIVPLFDLLRPIPPIAWIPIAILWFGLGNSSAVFIVAIGAFFSIFLNTYSGIRSVSLAHVKAAQCLGAGPLLIMTDVLLPAAMPQILTGLRVGLGVAWISVIAAEMIGAQEGLGYAIQLNRIMLETEAVVVNMIVIGMIGWAMNAMVGSLEQSLTGWNQGTLAAGQDPHGGRG